MIKRFLFPTLLLAFLVQLDLSAQSRAEIRDNFYDAESWILFEDYKEALPLYLQLLKVYPDNANLKYRIGQCYINTPGQKDKAITYLEEAVKHIDPKYREGKFRETNAPYDALYYLANAYRITNQLDKAIATYQKFKENLDSRIYDSTIVNMQITSCRNAKEIMSMPLYVKKTDLGNEINENGSEFDPVISDKEDKIIFARSEAFYDAILYSTKVDNKWTAPENMNEILKIDRDLFPSSISKDGNTLYLYSSADYDGTIYTSDFRNGTWQPLIKLNDNINTKYWESHATISHDNKKLYFTSNRKGTLGGLDIFISKRDSTGDWGQAVNLGPVINTPYNEESPFLTTDDKTLFFSSRGHYNMGGYDIFYSTFLDNGEWSTPLNIGYPLNTTDDDVFFKPMNQGYEGYYAMVGSRGSGQQDIYHIEIFSENHPRKFLIRGVARVADLLHNFKDSVRISAMNIKDKNQMVVVYSDPNTGEYELELPQGKYQITYENTRADNIVRDIDLHLLNPSDSISLPITVLPKNDFVAEMEVESDKAISVTGGDTVMIPVRTEPGSILRIEHWVGDSLYSAEEHLMNDTLFIYKVVPKPGDNRIVFKLTDRFNNTTTTDIIITRSRRVIQKPVERPEYKRVIAEKQIDALASMLLDQSDDRLRSVINKSDINKQHFTKVDDLITYLKEQAAKDNISSEEIDILALKTAINDNVLTQAAVDLLARHTSGELKRILSDLDIYEENLKTWNDLLKYIEEKSGGRITADELNSIASDIINGVDPAISVLKEKILAINPGYENMDIVRRAVAETDKNNIKSSEKWLEAFSNEALKEGLSIDQLAELLARISSLPGTSAEQFLSDLISNSDEPLTSVLKSIDLNKEKIQTPGDLILYLLKNREKLNFPIEELYKALSRLIVSKDIPASTIEAQVMPSGRTKPWIPWVIGILLASGLGIFLIVVWKRRKRDKKQ